MAAALALSTVGAFHLAGETDVIVADRAAGDMLSTGAFTTSPTT